MKKILFLFLFFSSLLFSSTMDSDGCIDFGDGRYYKLGSQNYDNQDKYISYTPPINEYFIVLDGKTTSTANDGDIWIGTGITSSKDSYGWYTLYNVKGYSKGVECSPPPPPPPLTCEDGQYLDENNTCVAESFPTDFPTSDEKGTPKIVSDNTAQDACIIGTKSYSGIAYAEIIGWDSANNKCIWSAFFCNNGLTWDNLQQTCVIPADTTQFAPDNNDSLSNTNTISPELASACTSGSWAKTWTVDYCETPSPCYISLDLEDYNLNCGSKYIEYECTSDYRIKKFVQVSCGDISTDDYDNVTLDISSPDTNDVVPDTSTDASSTDVASIITAQSNLLNNNLDGLVETVKSSNDLQKDINNKIDGIQDTLNSIDDKVSILKDTKDLSEDSSSIQDAIFNALDDGFNTYLNRDYTGGLDTSSCPSIQTFSTVAFGHTITIFSQAQLDLWPMDIFKKMIIFMFVFSGVVMAFRTS